MAPARADTHQIKELIIQCLNLPDIGPEDIDDEAPLFVEGLGLDSVDALELVIGIEKRFSLVIEDEHIGKEAFASAAALTTFVNQRLKDAGVDPAAGQ